MPGIHTYPAVQSNLFVSIVVSHYKSTPTSTPRTEVLRFSDRREPFGIGGATYIGLGNLLGVSQSQSELRASSGELTITISGIPNTSISEIVNSRIKGCPVNIFRGLFDPVTNELLDIPGNPIRRYRGLISNYALNEEHNVEQRTASNTITLVCQSAIDILQNKYAGRKTNPVSQKKFFPGDYCMDRVPNLNKVTFDFGAPK